MTSTANAWSGASLREELVQQVAELGARGRVQPAAREIVDRDDAEIHEHHLQQVFARGKWIAHECAERLAIEVAKTARHSVVLPVPISPLTTLRLSWRRML